MKRLTLLAIAGLMAAAWASPSLAADLPRPAYKAPVYVAPSAFSWSGFYVGINGGYAWGHSDWNNGIMGNVSMNVKGGMVGGTLGYNLQTSSFVFGLEGDGSMARAEAAAPARPAPARTAKRRTPGLPRAAVASATPGIASCLTSRAARRAAISRRRRPMAARSTRPSSAGRSARVSNGPSCRTGRRRSNTSTPIWATSPAKRQPAAAARTPRSPGRRTSSVSA
jgi:opacity protein-like surface antigen